VLRWRCGQVGRAPCAGQGSAASSSGETEKADQKQGRNKGRPSEWADPRRAATTRASVYSEAAHDYAGKQSS